MQVHISIGKNQPFELRKALLVYVAGLYRPPMQLCNPAPDKHAPPILESAQPLTLGFVESLVHSLSGASFAEVLPENALASGERLLVWLTPACRRQMFYKNAEEKTAKPTFPYGKTKPLRSSILILE